jgi:antitoxin MazE
MKTQIGRWGNSLGIRIPKYIAEELALTVNGEVECRLENGDVAWHLSRGFTHRSLESNLPNPILSECCYGR